MSDVLREVKDGLMTLTLNRADQLNALSLEYAISGLPITLYVFLTSSLFLVLHGLFRGPDERAGAISSRRAGLVAAGVLSALLYLTDPVFIVLVLAVGTIIIRMAMADRPGGDVVQELPAGARAQGEDRRMERVGDQPRCAQFQRLRDRGGEPRRGITGKQLVERPALDGSARYTTRGFHPGIPADDATDGRA